MHRLCRCMMARLVRGGKPQLGVSLYDSHFFSGLILSWGSVNDGGGTLNPNYKPCILNPKCDPCTLYPKP